MTPSKETTEETPTETVVVEATVIETPPASAAAIEDENLDQLLAAYKASVELWITAIRVEEALALPDHSMRDWETWDRAVLDEKDAGHKAAEARKAYEEALRKALLNF